MNFTLNSIEIKSNWFDQGGIISNIGPKGFYLYLTLFKFRLHNQQHAYKFSTSVYSIKKEMNDKKYTAEEIYDLLRLLIRYRIIEIENISRIYQLKNNSDIDKNKHLIINATDVPEKNQDDETSSDKFVIVNLELINWMIQKELNEKHMLLHTLLVKYANNIKSNCWMSIREMSLRTQLNKDHISKLLVDLNKCYVVNSRKVKTHRGYGYEHIVCKNLKTLDEFIKVYQKEIDKNLKKEADKKETTEKEDRNFKDRNKKDDLNKNDLDDLPF